MHLAATRAFVDAIAAEGLTRQLAFSALEQLASQLLEPKVFTVMTYDQPAQMSTRLYSSLPEVYPVGGVKPYALNLWSETVLDARQTFVANDIETIGRVFHDASQMRSLGCEAIINIPVVVGGRVVAALNCSAGAGHYTPARVTASENLKMPGVICLAISMGFAVP